MTTKLRLVTPPEAAVSLAEARDYLRIIGVGSPPTHPEDALITRMIAAATNLLEGRAGFLGRCLEPASWELALSEFPDGAIYVPIGPVASVTSVAYTGAAGAGTVDPADYQLDAATYDARIVPRDGFAWPATAAVVDAVVITFVAGTGTPEPVRAAIYDMIAAAYETRGGGKMLTPGIVADLAPYRRPAVL